jgi:hypothetical protein
MAEQLAFKKFMRKSRKAYEDKGTGLTPARFLDILCDQLLPDTVSPIRRTEESEDSITLMRSMIARMTGLWAMSATD